MFRLPSRRDLRYVDFALDLVAITRDQVKEIGAPPFPAKMTSARYAEYRRRTGTAAAWELDALPP